jgi:hypothetical protein
MIGAPVAGLQLQTWNYARPKLSGLFGGLPLIAASLALTSALLDLVCSYKLGSLLIETSFPTDNDHFWQICFEHAPAHRSSRLPAESICELIGIGSSRGISFRPALVLKQISAPVR